MIRFAGAEDVGALSGLIGRYMREALTSDGWGGSEDALHADLEAQRLRVLVAEHRGVLVGFAALVDDYDLHHCVRGVRVIDLYVTPEARLRSTGVALLGHVAQDALERELRYVRGEALPRRSTRHLFARVALNFGQSYNLSGRALRTLAGLRDARPREILRGLPPPEANREP